MKKKLIIVTVLSLTTFVLTSAILIPNKKKTNQPTSVTISKSSRVKVPTCNCGQVTGVQAQVNGSFVTISWNSVSGAQSYSLGGYYSPGGTPFAYCATGTSYTISYGGGGTARVTANCDNTVCTSATCSGNPSLPVSW